MKINEINLQAGQHHCLQKSGLYSCQAALLLLFSSDAYCTEILILFGILLETVLSLAGTLSF